MFSKTFLKSNLSYLFFPNCRNSYTVRDLSHAKKNPINSLQASRPFLEGKLKSTFMILHLYKPNSTQT